VLPPNFPTCFITGATAAKSYTLPAPAAVAAIFGSALMQPQLKARTVRTRWHRTLKKELKQITNCAPEKCSLICHIIKNITLKK
jgi:hypothetical protein